VAWFQPWIDWPGPFIFNAEWEEMGQPNHHEALAGGSEQRRLSGGKVIATVDGCPFKERYCMQSKMCARESKAVFPSSTTYNWTLNSRVHVRYTAA